MEKPDHTKDSGCNKIIIFHCFHHQTLDAIYANLKIKGAGIRQALMLMLTEVHGRYSLNKIHAMQPHKFPHETHLLSLYSFAASLLAGDFGLGSDSRDYTRTQHVNGQCIAYPLYIVCPQELCFCFRNIVQ